MPFSSFGLHADILRGIKDLAFTHPTPIQDEAIPPAMLGKDVLACAMTGSGKTAAFMLPIIHKLMTKPVTGQRRTRALVLTPTRELAAQILDNLSSLAVHTPINGAAIIGGLSMGPQAHAFRAGTDILIATPGRLLDHLRYPYAKLDGLEFLVLDEADRMLDMGFLPDIRRILRVVPQKRQTLFFSATMPVEIRQLMNEMLKDPVAIQLERQATPAGGITQAIYPVPQHLKTLLLRKLLEHEGLESVICFTRTKQRANRLAASLTAANISCVPIHGNRSQGQRTAALSGFKAGRYRVLVATDIAARGIDIADVSHVINFDCPHVAEDYIHRVGRTGRAAATGDAFTFVSEEEQSNLRTIERAIGKRLPRVTLPDFDYNHKPAQSLETAVAERIAAIKREKSRQGPRGGRDGGHRDNGQRDSAPRGNRDGNTGAARPAHAPQYAGGQSAQPNPRDGHAPQQPGRSGGQSHQPGSRPQGAPGGRHGGQPNHSLPDGSGRTGGQGGGGTGGHKYGAPQPRRPGGGAFGRKDARDNRGHFKGPASPKGW